MRPKVVLTREENNLKIIQADYPDIEWISFPLITFEYVKVPEESLKTALKSSSWLVFTSQNGIKAFEEQYKSAPAQKIACVGPKTRDLAESLGFEVHFMPSYYTSKILAEELPVQKNDSICYIGGNLSSDETINILKKRSSQFFQLEVYKTVAKLHPPENWQHLLNTEPNLISFCSPSAVRSFIDQLNKLSLAPPGEALYAAIGTTTALSIKDYIGKSAIVGENHTFEGMIQKITETVENDQKTQKT